MLHIAIIDAVTFSKKMLSGGIFHKSSLRPPQAGRLVNTWVGDPHKVLMLEAVSLERCSQKSRNLTIVFIGCKRNPKPKSIGIKQRFW